VKRLTPEEIAAKKELILRRLRKGMTRAAAAESVGLHRKTVYEWSKSDESFGDAIANRVALFGRELVSAMVEISRDKAHTKRMEATKYLLESRFPDESPRVNQLVADAMDEYDRRVMDKLRGLETETREKVAHALMEAKEDIRNGRGAPPKPSGRVERPAAEPAH
jgi:hypothetical protein